MNVRAVIFDLYKTLLRVGPPPPNAEKLWSELLARRWPQPPSMTLAQFAAACEAVTVREHARARAVGIPHPEVFWPAVASEVLPCLAHLTQRQCDDFLFAHAQLVRTISLSPGAAEIISHLHSKGVLLGLASNSQPYTARELELALASSHLSGALFQPQLCFWSFRWGFSKPDPHVFRALSARLLEQRIVPAQILMVGDREDNDIAPARAQGWQTWQLADSAPALGPGGSWRELKVYLDSRITHTTS